MAVTPKKERSQNATFYSVAALAPFWVRPGFAVPLFKRDTRSNSLYVQIVSTSKIISGFEHFDVDEEIVFCQSPAEVKIGDSELYAIVDKDDFVHVGTRKSLASVARISMREADTSLQRMSFAIFSGNNGIARTEGKKVFAEKSLEFQSRELAAEWMANNIILRDVLGRLSNYQRLGVRGDVEISSSYSVRTRAQGKRVSLEIISPSLGADYINRAKFNRLTGSLALIKSITGFSVDITRAPQSISDNTEISREEMTYLVDQACRHARQEERLASMLSLILQHESSAEELLDMFTGSATFERNAISLVANKISKSPDRSVEQIVSTSIRGILEKAYPMRRGKLLLDFATHLATSRLANDVIRQIVRKSRSLDIQSYAAEINSRLSV